MLSSGDRGKGDIEETGLRLSLGGGGEDDIDVSTLRGGGGRATRGKAQTLWRQK